GTGHPSQWSLHRFGVPPPRGARYLWCLANPGRSRRVRGRWRPLEALKVDRPPPRAAGIRGPLRDEVVGDPPEPARPELLQPDAANYELCLSRLDPPGVGREPSV